MAQPAELRFVMEPRLVAALASLKAEILGGADPAFDTLLELQQALGDNPDFAATVINELSTKVDDTDPRLSDARTPTTHRHTPSSDLDAAGSPSNFTFLRGDNSWAVPNSGMTQTEAEMGIDGAVRVISPARLRAAIQHHAGLKPWQGTQAAYDALGTYDADRTYYIV